MANGMNIFDKEWSLQASLWLPIETAPKDGAPILLKFKDDLDDLDDYYRGRSWEGLIFVARHRGDDMLWGFAAPVGTGGFEDGWFDGWRKI